MNFLIRLFITAVVAYFLAYFLPGIHFTGFGGAVIFSIVFGILNVIVKPILKVLGFPLTIITLGLFSLVINALVVLMADYFIDSMNIDGFLWAFIFSIALSFLTSLINGIFTSKE